MRRFLIIVFIILTNNLCLGQSHTIISKKLSDDKIDLIFTDNLKAKLKISDKIINVYEYQDLSGVHLIILTGNPIKSIGYVEHFDSIKAYAFIRKEENYTLEWAMKDFILPKGNEVSKEHAISFWTTYFETRDYDHDGFVDPILVYGTLGINGTGDGRIKILIYHKGQKTAIRHQNGTLDFERKTQVDQEFYELPEEIQLKVKELMSLITKNDHGIFPYRWQEAMNNKELKFDEY